MTRTERALLFHMVLNLNSLPRKAAAAIVAAGATLGLSVPLWSQFRAAQLSAEGTQESLSRAIQLQPANAEIHNRYGRVLLYSPLADAAQAKAALLRAVELDPRNGAYWIDLATAREIEGDVEGAAAAIERGRAAEPRTPALLWYAANFEVRQGHLEATLDLLRQLMQSAPEYTARALPLFSRVTEPEVLVGEVVPATRPAMSAAVEFMRRENHLSAAAVAWERILKMEDPPLDQIRPYVDWLVASGETELAHRAWVDAAQRGWIPVPAESAADPLYNADFRHPLEDFGFDWRILPNPIASVWLEGRGPQPGMNSLCIQLSDEARATYSHVQHYVPVRPRYFYALQASMRSERLASRTGAFLQILDPFSGQAGVRTDAVTGTGGWRDVMVSVETGPETRVLRLDLVRPAPPVAEEAASGMVCMAGLRWTELGPAKGPAAPLEKTP